MAKDTRETDPAKPSEAKGMIAGRSFECLDDSRSKIVAKANVCIRIIKDMKRDIVYGDYGLCTMKREMLIDYLSGKEPIDDSDLYLSQEELDWEKNRLKQGESHGGYGDEFTAVKKSK